MSSPTVAMRNQAASGSRGSRKDRRVSDDLSGPIAQGFQHVQVTLPGAARELAQLIEVLDQYHDRPR